jgi:prepilin-type N-terminal cleavage/methylation domain-containing protein
MKLINKKAFTLIELLVVVLIIGILAAIALPKYQVAVEKARTREVMTLMRSIKNAADMVKMVKGGYTAKFDDLDIVLPCQTRGTTTWGDYCDTTYFRIFLHNDTVGGTTPSDIFNILAHREKISKIDGGLSKTYEIQLTTNNPNNSNLVFLCQNGGHASSPKNWCQRMGYTQFDSKATSPGVPFGPYLME